MKISLIKMYTIFVFCFFLASNAFSDMKLPAIISNNMVLQQQAKVRVWGWACPKSTGSIKPSWSKESFKVLVADDGKWETKIKTSMAGGLYEMQVKQNNVIKITNILIGEVWICSSQSNMTMPMKGCPNNPVKNSQEEIAYVKNDKIRFFDVGRSTFLEPKDGVKGSWKEASPETVADFNATAWFFGKTIEHKLRAPVGLITSSWGGSNIETWMSKNALASFNDIKKPVADDYKKAPQRIPSLLFNNMLYPLIGYGIKGVIWYQGESNVNTPEPSVSLMQYMVADWRNSWDNNFPFYYLQIAPFNYFPKAKTSFSSAYLGEAQVNAEKIIPNSGMGILMDIGEEIIIHPANKESTGTRLASLASRTYRIENAADTGPIYKSIAVKGNVALIKFSHTGTGLTSLANKLNLFENAGAGKMFYSATVTITPKGVEVSNANIQKPVALRYGFKDFAVSDLFNYEGFPASSFRTDNWSIPKIN